MQADTLFTGSIVEDTVVTAGDVRARADSVVDLGAATGEAVDTVQGFANAFYGSLPRIAIGLATSRCSG